MDDPPSPALPDTPPRFSVPAGRRRTSRVLDRNIHALVEKRVSDEQNRTREERVADAVTQFAGSMRFVYLHLVIFGAWVVINLGWIPGVPRFDASFVILAMVASVEAIFLSTFVLITQNRMAALSDTRADLDLQISLMSEHEITRVVRLVAAIGARMGIDEANDPELDEISRGLAPEDVLRQIEAGSDKPEQ